MATLQERIETATDVLETDAGLMHSIIHGGSTETVETEGGPVPTVAKQVADLEASYAAIDAVAVVAADRQAAETARGGAEDARDAAVAATANMLVKSNNLSDVPDPAAARDNLGVTEAIAATGMPVGSVMMLYGDDSEAPPGYLLMNGAAVTATYPELRAFGLARGWQVNGNGDPQLPDMGGYFPRGWRSGQLVDSGRQFGTPQSDAIRNITGTFNGGDHTEVAGGAFTAGANVGTITGGTGATKTWTFNAGDVVPTAADNHPYSYTFTFWIKAYPSRVDTGSIDLAQLTVDINGVAVRTTALENARSAETSVELTGLSQALYSAIPAAANKIHVRLSGVNPATSIDTLLRLITASGEVTSGYVGGVSTIDSSVTVSAYSVSFVLVRPVVSVRSGLITLARKPGTNIWTLSGSGGFAGGACWQTGGACNAGATVTGVRLFGGGSGSFSSGSVGFWWEK